ncbi:MAG: BON domain-containing protein [Desulfomonilia bacterium]|jgi:osmotically-inducible protein OsmY|uniref:Periplasmic protein n=1 Tax=anaerobic digester metagenome TaxID=1263854 RepID=A0A485LY82_9ZZZZ|nr:BON domain-containing protein [Pseudomonadota bacterium]HON38696.1 BON domain-containing protein [Deltaproteobacteria bacterium]HRS55848.1 BON domain-containing protein [Desulfomonilia bacterium]HPD20969.1 BON domain-containing protein [Deltaproteobacteria bacterium]HPX17473.1 BON domain-containing protein [Deltaproteobacteria bacterium]
MTRTVIRGPEQIRIDVIFRLMEDSRIDESSIHVDALGGNIILTGRVPSDSARVQAENDAYAVSGVRYVDNRLTITLPSSIRDQTDADIASAVIGGLHLSPNIDSAQINVSVNEGLVRLEGYVESSWAKAKAGELASEVPGVSGVHNLLTVKPAEILTDETIERDIINALQKGTSIDTSAMTVRVENGVASLRGTIFDVRDYDTAEELVRHTAGVLDVINELVIA